MSPRKARTGSPKQLASGAKVPKVDERVVHGPDAGEHKVTFSFHYADHGYQGPWSWPTAADADELLQFLCNVSRSSWHEIRAQLAGSKGGAHRKHHFQEVGTLSQPAQERLAQLRLVEVFGGDIFRFRVGNRKRLWGFIAAGVFYVLWWDADHAVYPLEDRSA
ncbi:hypothetical protein [Actinoplanes regularis]|uniref:hypothetical protein n=1 Tax=Actinoplanes regularis TaxID=52697 RepID=UPI00249F95FC|nr:hypothetical protein [Actinoplanes regularis]GLW28387.1 hypothetical protein Areg01_13270 [Actinoplanes regularis]